MTALPRVKPNPTPPVRPVPEYAAEGWRKDWYEDVKDTLQVPWMGVVTMAYAHYPRFFEAFWRSARELCLSRPFVDACAANRAFVEDAVKQLDLPPIAPRLEELGYAPRELESIREIIDVFSHGNQPYFVLATLTRALMEGVELAGDTDPAAAPHTDVRHGPEVEVPLVLMEPHHADAPTQQVYADVKSVLGLPFVNTDYRALARWPSYWATAWGDLRAVVTTSAHEAICQQLNDTCVQQVTDHLPNPGKLTAQTLRQAATQDGDLEEIRDVCRLFQWLLPGLITNVACLRAQL